MTDREQKLIDIMCALCITLGEMQGRRKEDIMEWVTTALDANGFPTRPVKTEDRQP